MGAGQVHTFQETKEMSTIGKSASKRMVSPNRACMEVRQRLNAKWAENPARNSVREAPLLRYFPGIVLSAENPQFLAHTLFAQLLSAVFRICFMCLDPGSR
jgi:hypothetical protein